MRPSHIADGTIILPVLGITFKAASKKSLDWRHKDLTDVSLDV